MTGPHLGKQIVNEQHLAATEICQLGTSSTFTTCTKAAIVRS